MAELVAQLARHIARGAREFETLAHRLAQRHQPRAHAIPLRLRITPQISRAHQRLQMTMHAALCRLKRARKLGHADRPLVLGDVFEDVERKHDRLNAAATLCSGYSRHELFRLRPLRRLLAYAPEEAPFGIG